MNIYAIPAALAFVINLALCLIVFFDNPKGIVNRVFTLCILSFVAWNAGELIMITSEHHEMALIGVKIIFCGVFLFPIFFLHFSYVFPQKFTHFFDGWRNLILYAAPLAILTPFILLLQVDIGRVLKIGSIFLLRIHFSRALLESHVLAIILALIGLAYFAWGITNFILSYRRYQNHPPEAANFVYFTGHKFHVFYWPCFTCGQLPLGIRLFLLFRGQPLFFID